MECFRPLRCSMDGGGIPGDARPPIATGGWFAAPVFRLSKLGFRRPFSGGGLINDGDEGSEVWKVSAPVLRLSAKLFRFLVLRGPGDVIGLSSLSCNRMGAVSAIFKL